MADKNKFEAKRNEGRKIFVLIFTLYFNAIVLIIILMVFAASYFYLLNPKWQEIIEKREGIMSEKTAQKEKLQNIYKRIERYKSDYDDITDGDKEKINNLFMGGVGDEKFGKEKLFAFFESFISSQGLILKSVDIAQNDETKKDQPKKTDSVLPTGVGVIEVTLDISGADYKAFKNLLAKIENSMQVMDVSDLSFSPEDNSVNLKIATYYYKQ